MDFPAVLYWIWAVYGVLFTLTVVIMVLAASLLIVLIRLLRTLNDYWRLRTAAQYADSDNSQSNP
jgi:ABC-type transport system involved in Fe-S cluster assembly fused permease/ATPase subunit